MTRHRAVLTALATVALAEGIAMLLIADRTNHFSSPLPKAALYLLLSWSFVGAGLAARAQRPENRMGVLLVAVGLFWLTVSILDFSNGPVPFTIAAAVQAVVVALFLQALLSFPTGVIKSRAELALIALGYAVALLANTTTLLVHPATTCDGACPRDVILVARSQTAYRALTLLWDAVAAVIAVAVLVVLYRRLRNASAAARRTLWPVLLGGAVTMLAFAGEWAADPFSRPVADGFDVVAFFAFASVPFLFLAGLLRSRLARADVGRVFVDVPEEPTPADIRDAFRRALHDPSVELAYWLPEQEEYVDLGGRPIEEGGRTVTPIEYEGRRMGALVHDPTLREDPALVEAAVAAARIGMEKDRLNAELRARLRELERERDFVRTVVDTLPPLICTLDHKGHVHRMNRTVVELCCRPGAPDVHGRFFWDLFLPEEDHQTGQEALAAAREGVFGVEHETGWITAGGVRHTIAWTLTPIVNAQGQPRILLTGMDVTDRKREEARTRALLDALPDMMFRIRRDGVYVDYHVHDERELVTPEVVGRRVHDRLPAEVAEQMLAATRRALDEGGIQTYEYELPLDGDRRYYEARVVASAENEVVAIVRDITDRKRQEEELRASERRSRALLAAIPDNMFRLRRDGTIIDFHVNEPELLPAPPEQMVGALIGTHGHPELRELTVAAAERALETGELQMVEYRIADSDREARIVPSGHDEVVMIARDITERRRQEEALRESRARIVEAADAERRRLERNLHDGAQQRLVSLSLALRLARSRVADDPEGAKAILADAARELAHALEELRELARGIHPAVLTDRGLAAAVESLAARAPLPVEVEACPVERLPAPVEAAAYYVIAEGLTNVVKYAQASEVRVSIERIDGYAAVEIADDGVGGADPSRGTGLRGLADRVEALDGRLAVESRTGGGTTIRAEIPTRSG